MDSDDRVTPVLHQNSCLEMETERHSQPQDDIVKKQLAECDFDTMKTILESAGLGKSQCVFLPKEFVATVHTNGYY